MSRPRIAAALALATLVTSAPARAVFDPDEDRPVRIVSETGFGILGGTAGVFAGGLLGMGVCALTDKVDTPFGCILPVFIGGILGEFAGIGLGVYGGASIVGGNGGLGWTYLGETGGALVGTAIVLGADVDFGSVSWWLITGGMPIVGAILGYELSTTREGPRTIGASFVFPF